MGLHQKFEKRSLLMHSPELPVHVGCHAALLQDWAAYAGKCLADAHKTKSAIWSHE
jgi:hypothetical protein